MLARIAHELYWLGRNLARAEFTARAVDGVFRAELQSAYTESHPPPACASAGTACSRCSAAASATATATARRAARARRCGANRH